MWNIHVKLYEIWTCGSEEMSFKEKVYGRSDNGRTTDKDRSQAFGSGELKERINLGSTGQRLFFQLLS